MWHDPSLEWSQVSCVLLTKEGKERGWRTHHVTPNEYRAVFPDFQNRENGAWWTIPATLSLGS